MGSVIDYLTIGRVFEAASGSLLVLDIFILAAFVLYIRHHVSPAREAGESWLSIYRNADFSLMGAVGIAVFFTGATIGRGAMWGWRVALNRGVQVDAEIRDILFSVVIVGVAICCVGGFCILRVFTERRRSAFVQWSAGLLIAGMIAFAMV
jgi:hypothetical protein